MFTAPHMPLTLSLDVWRWKQGGRKSSFCLQRQSFTFVSQTYKQSRTENLLEASRHRRDSTKFCQEKAMFL